MHRLAHWWTWLGFVPASDEENLSPRLLIGLACLRSCHGGEEPSFAGDMRHCKVDL